MPRYATSYTGCEDFRACPRKFLYGRDPETKNKRVSCEPAIVGQVAHLAFERIQHLAVSLKRHPVYEEVVPLVTEACQTGSVDARDDSVIEQVLHHASAFTDDHPYEPSDHAFIEHRLAFKRDNGVWSRCDWKSSDALYRGVVDRYVLRPSPDVGTPTEVDLIDWKTGRRLEYDLVQLATYCWMLKMQYPSLQRFRASYYFSAFRKVETFEIGSEQLEQARAWIDETIHNIEHTTDFAAVPGKHCEYCGWAHICTAGKDIIARVDDEGPEMWVIALAQLEPAVENLRKMIKSHIRGSGAIAAPGVIADLRQDAPSMSISLEDLMVAVGADKLWSHPEWAALAPYIKVDTAGLKQLLEDPVLREALEPLVKVKQGAIRISLTKSDGQIDSAQIAAIPETTLPSPAEPSANVTDAKLAEYRRLRSARKLKDLEMKALNYHFFGKERLRTIRDDDLDRAIAALETATTAELSAAISHGFKIMSGEEKYVR